MTQKRKSPSNGKWILLIAFILIILTPYLSYQSFLKQKSCIDFPNGVFEVASGETFASSLKKVYDSEWFTKIYLKLNPPNFKLQAGKYPIQCGNIDNFINQLQKPINETDVKVTILEGWNMYDIDTKLVNLGLIKKNDFVEYIDENIALYKKEFPFLSPVLSLEGYLYPDTYFVNPRNFTVKNFTHQMLKNFDTKVMTNITDGNAVNMYQVINLASIVEKEEKDSKEKPTVAGILEKRIREGWMIGADATVCYPYKVTSDECTPDFILSHLYEKNSYNTRTMVGLPMTPISNPSYDTIEAVIKDEDQTPYYYYLHDSSGNIHYAKTNAEHEENKRKYIY